MIINNADYRIHPFDIEFPGEYVRLNQQDLEPDMAPFDIWEFYFDNGWGASVLDTHNENSDLSEGQRWIIDFGAWETNKNIKTIHHCRHPQLPDEISLQSIPTNEVGRWLRTIAYFDYRTYAARKVNECHKCHKFVHRQDSIIWDNHIRPYHTSCVGR